jgi:hypothetical protein
LDERRLWNPSLKLSEDSLAALLGLVGDYNPASPRRESEENHAGPFAINALPTFVPPQ